MTQIPSFDPSVRIFTFADVRCFYKKVQKKVARGLWIGASIALCFCFSRPPEYLIEAFFKESSEKIADQTIQLKQLLSGNLQDVSDSQFTVLARSPSILIPVIQKLGLQIKVDQEGMIGKIWNHFVNIFRAEFSHPLSDIDRFIFEGVVYEGEAQMTASLELQDPTHFIWKQDGKKYSGVFGAPFNAPDVSFTLVQLPQSVRFHKQYKVHLDPQHFAIENLRSLLQIDLVKNHQSIYQISLSHRDRSLGVLIVNHLALQYRSYVKEDYLQIANEQLGYLGKRQSEIDQKLDAFFEEYGAYLQNQLQTKGTFGFERELGALHHSYERMREQFEAICFEIEKINTIGTNVDGNAMALFDFPEIHHLHEQYHRLTQQKDLIAHQGNLSEIRSEYPAEIQGADLASLQALLARYIQELDQAELQLADYQQIEKQLVRSDFDLLCLSSLISDSVAELLLKQVGELSFKLKDRQTHSEKEELRWKDDLILTKQNFKDRLNQLIQTTQIKTTLFRAKMQSVEQGILCKLKDEFSMLLRTAQTLLQEKKESLLQQKELLQKRMSSLREEFVSIADHWKQEQMLQFQKELGIRMVGAVSELVESKTISQHFHQVASKLLDPAIKPLLPKSPKVLLMASVGGILGGSFTFFFLLLQMMFRGFPLTKEKLQIMGYPLLGEISDSLDGMQDGACIGQDLLFLRATMLFLKQKKIGLILGKGPDYSFALGAYLSQLGKKVILVRCDFDRIHKEHEKGLLQVLQGQEESILRWKGIDCLFSGGYTPYGVELLQSLPFKALIARYEAMYDYCLIVVRSPLDHMESSIILGDVDQAIVTVSDEKVEDLNPFMNLRAEKEITFIAYQGAS